MRRRRPSWRANLERAERKFDVMQELGTPLILVCSNVQPDALSDADQLAGQFHQLAEHAGRRGMRIAYEALAWGSQIKLWSQAWAVIERVNHPSMGLALDSFHTLALRDDPIGIARLPGDRIFFVQLADAPWVNTDVLTHSRHYRCFPGQGELAMTQFTAAVIQRAALARNFQRRIPLHTGPSQCGRCQALAAVARRPGAPKPGQGGAALQSDPVRSAAADPHGVGVRRVCR